MAPPMIATLGALAPPWRTLVARGVLLAPLALARAQVAAHSTSLAEDGLGLLEHGADTPRFTGAARRLLVEGQRTNGLPNPRAEGAAEGSPGTLPTGWALSASAPSLSRTVTPVTVAGMAGVSIRWFGTAAATASLILDFEPNASSIVAAPDQRWAASVTLARSIAVAAPPTNLRCAGRTTAGALVTGNSFTVEVAPGADAARFALPFLLTSAGTIARVNGGIQYLCESGVAYDWTDTYLLPQLELGPFASTPILPPIGTPGASTRGADLVSASLGSLGIGTSGACTILWSGVIPQAAPAAHSLRLFQADDGGDTQVFGVRVSASTSNLSLYRYAAGGLSDAAATAMTPGDPVRVAVSVAGDGTAACSINGGSVTTVTGGPAAGLTTIRLGNSAAGTTPLAGDVAHFRVLPHAVSSAMLPALAAALPL